MTSAKKKKKKKKNFFFFFFNQDDRYNTILSALETITKTAMRSVAIVMATTNKHIHTALINEMVVMYIITKMPHKPCVAFCYINKLNFVDGQDSI